VAELTTVAKLKTFLSITATTWDTLLTDLLEGAEDEIRRACNKGEGLFASGSRTQKFSGSSFDVLYLTHRPVTAITTVKVFTDSTNSTTVTSTDYRINDDGNAVLLQSSAVTEAMWTGVRTSRFWHPDYRSMAAYPYTEVIYTGGYATIPDDLEEAARWYAAQLFLDRAVNHGFQSENLDKYGYTVATPGPDGVSPRVRELRRRLAPFVVPS
jgi:uncharacterized phiE125 gp8 family phage protein